MSYVASRELRNNTRDLLERVASGERITITVRGRPVAELTPVVQRPQWMPREGFVREVLSQQADAGLGDDLVALSNETTDDLPWL